jgi:hypothetical protein
MSGFLDHFDSTLNARWTAVTGGTGTAVVADGYLKLNRPAGSGDQAYVYLNTPLDKSVDWSLEICCSNNITNNPRPLSLIESASPGGLTNATSLNNVELIRPYQQIVVSGRMSQLEYRDGSSNRQRWNNTTPAFANGDPSAGQNPPAALDDYYVMVFQNDGASQRWRIGIKHESAGTGSTFTNSQGPKLVILSDWVNWSSVRSTPQSNIYLILGYPANDGTATDHRIEYVKYRQSAFKAAWTNGRTNSGSSYSMRKYVGHEDIYLPIDRSTDISPFGTPKDQWVVLSGGVEYMFYDSSGNIRMQTATAPASVWTNETWSDQGIVVANAGAGTTETNVLFPCVVKDLSETDSNKVWKMIYVGNKTTPSLEFRIFYATAPDSSGAPGTWTKQGAILEPNGSGFEIQGCSNPALIWSQGRWELYYSGLSNSAYWEIGYAYGTDLMALTRYSGNPIITWQSDGEQAISADVNGRTAAMSDTSGFTADHIVVIQNASAAEDDYSLNRIRKITANTSLEFYHDVRGFVSSGPAVVTQDDRAHGYCMRDIYQDPDTLEWIFDGVIFRHSQHANISYCETTARWRHSGTYPASSLPVLSALEYFAIPLTNYGFQRSSENICYVTTPLTRAIGGGPIVGAGLTKSSLIKGGRLVSC